MAARRDIVSSVEELCRFWRRMVSTSATSAPLEEADLEPSP